VVGDIPEACKRWKALAALFDHQGNFLQERFTQVFFSSSLLLSSLRLSDTKVYEPYIPVCF